MSIMPFAIFAGLLLLLVIIFMIGISYLFTCKTCNNTNNTSTSTTSSSASSSTSSSSVKNYIVVLHDQKSCPKHKIGEICSHHGIHKNDVTVLEDTIKGFVTKLSPLKYEELKNHPSVKHIEEDLILSLPKQPHVPPLTSQGQQTPWNVSREGGVYKSPVTTNVFVIDTGIAPHPDLNIVSSVSFVPGNPSGRDKNGHGTNVAGIIGARNNNIAVVGVAPGCPLHSVQVLDEKGSGLLSNVIKGVQYVTKLKQTKYANSPVVANMSLGAYVGTTNYGALDMAVDAAIKAGVIMVIAAGNDGQDAMYYSPAHVTSAITVGSYGRNNEFSYFSNRGPDVCILGAGENCTSCGLNGGLSTMSGTSMAAPGVAAWCAIFLSDPKNANKTPAQVKAAIQSILSNSKNPRITNVPNGTVDRSIFIQSSASQGPVYAHHCPTCDCTE